MPLSWNEIRNRAHEFSRKWEGEESERAEAQSFWNDFFAVFGIERKRVAIFEKQVQIARAGEKHASGGTIVLDTMRLPIDTNQQRTNERTIRGHLWASDSGNQSS